MNAGANLRDVWFYRDSKKREIDLVIQEGHILHPVEIKTAATVSADAVKSFRCLEGIEGYEVGLATSSAKPPSRTTSPGTCRPFRFGIYNHHSYSYILYSFFATPPANRCRKNNRSNPAS